MGFVIFMAVIVSVSVFACLIQGNGDKEEQSMDKKDSRKERRVWIKKICVG